MKIAALIQAHHRPEQLSLLLNRLDGDLWSSFVHIDRKTDLGLFDGLQGRATFLDNRASVNWAGRSQVEACLLLMRAAIADPAITHFYYMSGQCYPVKTDQQIVERIESMPAGSANFISLEAMPVSHKPLDRYSRRHLVDVKNPLLRRVLARVFRRLPDQPVFKLRGIHLFGGSQWWLLERAAVDKILAFIEDNRWYWNLFKYAHCPDEMLLHSLMAPLGITVGSETATATVWIQGRPNPETITREMHDSLVLGPEFFARKYVDFHPAT